MHAGGWFVEHGLAHANEVLSRRPDGVFCCNDRLAEALIRSLPPLEAVSRPMIIGFDDAPIAAALQLNTIAIPWDELVSAAVKMIKTRLSGDRSAAIHQVVAPQPVRRQ
jgi:DNA-binding LacI/PurR family transcriptional regulator